MHPLLQEIDAAPEHVKLYAFNGFAVSWAAEIEYSMFLCFGTAASLPWEEAVDRFYERVSFSNKRTMAHKAVTAKLAGTPYLARWEALHERIQDLLGEGRSDRNLVSHNAVHVSIYANGPLEEDETDIRIVQEIRQSPEHIRRGRTERTVSATEMRDYCEQLVRLTLDLNEFLREVLGFGPSHALRRARV